MGDSDLSRIVGDDSISMLSLLDTVNVENRKDWEAWREKNKQTYIFGSKSPYFMNVGYESCKKTLKNIIEDKEEEKEKFFFVELAMEHGNKYELAAKLCLMREEKETMHDFHDPDVKKSLPTFICQWEDIKIAGTPDFITERNKEIVEIKCPFYFKFKGQTVEEGMNSFLIKHPLGQTNAFIQALFYSQMFKTNRFSIFVYFNDGFEEGYYRFFYIVSYNIGHQLYCRLKDIYEAIQLKKSDIKLKNLKTQVQTYQRLCFIHKTTMAAKLDKHSKNYKS